MKYTTEQLNKIMEADNGNLDIRGAKVTELPKNLTVEGDLRVLGAKVIALLDALKIGAQDFTVYGSQITELPENLTVKGDFCLSGTKIEKLPDNLTVGG